MSTLLHDALEYLDRGLAPIPMVLGKNKKPITKYKQFYEELPTEQWVRKQFSRRGVNGIGVLPVNSGIATRDFDIRSEYDRWADENKTLARKLPTHTTKRGVHVVFSSDRKDIVHLRDGEYRGDGLSVWPRSVRNGFTYEWIIPLCAGKLPFVPSKLFVGDDDSETSETSEAIVSAVSDVSVLSESLSSVQAPAEIIRQTLPKKSGERNEKVLALARGIKFNCGMANADSGTLKGIVWEWHRQALPFIETKDFDITLADFFHAFDRARHPLGNVVDLAAASVDPCDLPAAADQYEGIPMKRLVALCAALGAMHPKGHFFFSSHDAGRRVGVLQKHAWRLLELLQRDGVIERIERGNERRATRYRWIGGRPHE